MKIQPLLVGWLAIFPVVIFAQLSKDVPPPLSDHTIFDRIELEEGFPDPYTPGIFQDRQGFMWFSNKKGLIRYDGLTFRLFQHDPEDPSSISNDFVWLIDEDEEGYLWVPTYGGGLNRFDPATETFSVFPLKPSVNGSNNRLLWSATVDRRNRIWVGTRGDGLYIIDADRDSVAHFTHDPEDPGGISSNLIFRMFEDREGRYWLATNGGGLNLFDPDTGRAIHYRHQPDDDNSLVNNFIGPPVDDGRGNLWIPSWTGLSVLHIEDGRFTNYFHEPDDPNSLSSSLVYTVNKDAADRMWVATSKGLNLYNSRADRFSNFSYDPFNPHSLIHDFVFSTYEDRSGLQWISTANGISKLSHPNYFFISLVKTIKEKKISDFEGGFIDFLQDSHGKIWIGTNNGLYRYDPTSGDYRHFLLYPNWRIEDIEEDAGGKIWILGNGWFYYDPSAGAIRPACEANRDLCDQVSRWRTFVFDDQNRLWVADGSDLLWVDPAGAEIVKRYTAPAGTFVYIRDIQMDAYGRLWLGGDSGGLQYFDPESERFYRPELPDFPAGAIASFSPNGASIFLVDRKSYVWVNTLGKLWRYPMDEQANLGQPTAWKTDGGAFHKDEKDRYWLVTSREVKLFDPGDGKARTFSLAGITRRLDGTLLADASGKVYLGGYQGMYYFDPDRFTINATVPNVVLTGLRIRNQPVPVRGARGDTLPSLSPLEKAITHTDQIKLRHDDNDLSIEFATLDFHQPQGNRYKYLLAGYDPDTLYTSAQAPVATYTNLSPGRYTFRVWGSNSDGIWNKEGVTLSIHILSPWYWAWWSKGLYLSLVIGILYALYHFQLERGLAAAEARRLQELDTVKTRLYTNITHEFRTPLTVISGMARQVLEDPKEWFREGLDMILRNSSHLLRLVNQMLDLSKLEAGRLPVRMVCDDIIPYLRYLTESFHSYAGTKDIRLHLLPQVASLEMDFDPEKIQTIFANLVSNAIKFTPAGGDVYISVTAVEPLATEAALELKVRDTGVGIPVPHLPYIFDRFYQVDDSTTRPGEGTGIGLALTRELVRLLDGDIQVMSEVGKGTEFTVCLPVRRSADPGIAREMVPDQPQPSEVVGAAGLSGEDIVGEEDQPLALLIEDHADVLRYLTACLEGQYRIATATNGREGIRKAVELVPDIIISDVMMPQADGFEVVARLKQDERTSHIPIILLTAKADMDSRLEGLESGADAYLAKPFQREELEVRLRKLVELRQSLVSRYGQSTTEGGEDESGQTREDAFLARVRQSVEKRISDEAFGIPQLCRELNISRTQLHRKLKALTGRSTSQVIRTIRLQRAKELLENSDLNVAEVGYAVGFVNRSHFSTAFSEEFGMAPSAFRS